MIGYEKKTETVNIVVSKTCDVCGTTHTDVLDMQEYKHIRGRGGYNSAIGDDVDYECDLCSKCILAVLGKYLRTLGIWAEGENTSTNVDCVDNL